MCYLLKLETRSRVLGNRRFRIGLATRRSLCLSPVLTNRSRTQEATAGPGTTSNPHSTILAWETMVPSAAPLPQRQSSANGLPGQAHQPDGSHTSIERDWNPVLARFQSIRNGEPSVG